MPRGRSPAPPAPVPLGRNLPGPPANAPGDRQARPASLQRPITPWDHGRAQSGAAYQWTDRPRRAASHAPAGRGTNESESDSDEYDSVPPESWKPALCFFCGNWGHKSSICPYREGWYPGRPPPGPCDHCAQAHPTPACTLRRRALAWLDRYPFHRRVGQPPRSWEYEYRLWEQGRGPRPGARTGPDVQGTVLRPWRHTARPMQEPNAQEGTVEDRHESDHEGYIEV